MDRIISSVQVIKKSSSVLKKVKQGPELQPGVKQESKGKATRTRKQKEEGVRKLDRWAVLSLSDLPVSTNFFSRLLRTLDGKYHKLCTS